jgi:opacity protein-like surface antigen
VAIADGESNVSADSDWSGGYIGLSYLKRDLDVSTFSFDGNGLGAHGGYLHDFGNVVLGAELSFDQTDYDISSTATANLDSKSLMIIAGYDLGKILPYVTVGKASLTNGSTFAAERTDLGNAFGVGVEYQVAEHIRIGLEYQTLDISSFDNLPVDYETSSVSMRMSYNF